MSILTKVFIVLQLVFSIVVAVMVVMVSGPVQQYKQQVTNAQSGRLAAQAETLVYQNDAATVRSTLNTVKADSQAHVDAAQKAADQARADLVTKQGRLDVLEAQVDEFNKNMTRLTSTNAAQKDQIATLLTELTTMRADYNRVIPQNAELNRKASELANQLDAAQKAIRTLQEELATSQAKPEAPKAGATAAGTGTAVAQLSVGTPTSIQINGKVQSVETLNGKTFVTLSLGSRDGVAIGNRFLVYRDNTYVGDVVIQRVTPDQTVGVVTISKSAVKESDLVISGGGL